MLEMRVNGICRCSHHPMPAIVLRDQSGARLLAIGISPPEAERIAHELRRGRLCQPSIYTLAKQVLSMAGANGNVIPWLDHSEGALVGGVEFTRVGVRISLDCAPRDVAVLAAQWGVPIIVRDALAADVEQTAETVATEHLAPSDAGAWLERIRPEDFS